MAVKGENIKHFPGIGSKSQPGHEDTQVKPINSILAPTNPKRITVIQPPGITNQEMKRPKMKEL
jgi:hypothetical protein